MVKTWQNILVTLICVFIVNSFIHLDNLELLFVGWGIGALSYILLSAITKGEEHKENKPTGWLGISNEDWNSVTWLSLSFFIFMWAAWNGTWEIPNDIGTPDPPSLIVYMVIFVLFLFVFLYSLYRLIKRKLGNLHRRGN